MAVATPEAAAVQHPARTAMSEAVPKKTMTDGREATTNGSFLLHMAATTAAAAAK
ncbi:hypothetical protein [Sphingomonas sp. 28-63-12]|uniref:hypothetical protein n=1 Tax=Sphingomonas sp. 28-63-12 TaxID=1970434 RepID=UPI0035A97C46